jgi:hypothetical protein
MRGALSAIVLLLAILAMSTWKSAIQQVWKPALHYFAGVPFGVLIQRLRRIFEVEANPCQMMRLQFFLKRSIPSRKLLR